MLTVKVPSAAQVCCCSSLKGGVILSLLLNGRKNAPVVSRTAGRGALDTTKPGAVGRAGQAAKKQASTSDAKTLPSHQDGGAARRANCQRWASVRPGAPGHSRPPRGRGPASSHSDPCWERLWKQPGTSEGHAVRTTETTDNQTEARGPDAVARHRLQNKHAECARRDERQDWRLWQSPGND